MARNKEMKIAIKIAGQVEASLKNALGQVNKGLSSAARSAARTTKAMAAGTAAATLGIGAAAIKVGKEFETAMSQVSATMLLDKGTKEGREAFNTLEGAARECGRTTAFSATEAAEGLNYLALAGYDAEKAATALPTILRLAGAGAMELADASDMVTDAMSALGKEATQANLEGFADQLAQTASRSNTSVAQLGQAILTVGGTAKGLAGDTVELNAALGILADSGIKSAEGGTHLRNMIMSLQKARNDDAAGMFERMGLSAYDAAGDMRSLGDVFGDLNEQLKDASAQEVNNTLSTIFEKTDLAAARAMMAATADSIDAVGAAIDASLADAGTSMAELGIDLADMAKGFDAATTQEQFAAQMMAEFGMAGEQAGVIFNGMQSIVSNTGNRFQELSGYIAESAGACQKMYDIQNDNLEGDIAILKSGMADLGVGIYKDVNTPLRDAVQLASQMEGALSQGYDAGGFSGMAAAVGGCISDAVQAVAGYAPKMASAGTDLIQNLVSGVSANAGTLAASAAQTLGTFVEGAAAILPQAFLLSVDLMTGLAQGIAAQLPQMAASGVQAITDFASGLAQRMPEITDTALTLVRTVIDSLTANGPQLLAAAGMIVASLGGGIMQALPELAQMGVEVLEGLASGISANLPQMIPAAMDALVQFSGSLRTNVGLLVDAGLDLIMALAQSLIANIPVFIETIPTIITNLCGIINDNAPKLLSAGIQLLVQLAVGLIQAIPTLIGNIPQIIQAVVAVFTAFNWASLGRSAVTAIKDGIHSLATSLPAAFKSICSKAKDAFKNVDWRATGAGIIRTIRSGIYSLVDAIPKVLKSIGSKAWKWMKSVDWKDLGIKVIKGIIGGITSMGKGAWKAIKGIFAGKDRDKGVDMSGTGKEAVHSYAGAVTESAPEASEAAASVSRKAFRGAATAGTQEAGSRAGQSFAAAVGKGISTADVDISKAVDKPGTDARMRAAGRAGARAARNGMQAGVRASKVDLGKMKVDTKSFSGPMRTAGRKGSDALNSEVKKGAEGTVKATAKLGRDMASQMDKAWERIQSDAGRAMDRLTDTLTQAAQKAAGAVKRAFEGMTIQIPAPRIPEIQVTKTTVSYGSGRSRETIEVPRFNTVWHAAGGIFERPTLFDTPLGTHGVGEAGPEAILPLDLLWKKMGYIMDSQGTSLVDRILDRISKIGGSADGAGPQQAQTSSAGGGGMFKIEYAPTYNLYGDTSEQGVREADGMSRKEFFKEFNKAMRLWEKEQARRKFKR